uniref:Uncharacterized protein n=1 Tax=Heterosigma akashiwo TaxID=2829 RepID=A0A7S3Y007_HETAK
MPRPLTGVQSNSDLASVHTFAMAGTRQRVRSTASSTTSAAPPKLPVLAFPLLSGTVVGNGHGHQQTGLALNDGLEAENGVIEKEENEEDEENAAAALYASSCSAGEFLGPILGGLAVQLLPRSKELTCSDVPVSLCLYAFPWAATTLGIFNIVMAILLWLVLPSLTGIQRTTARSSYEKLHGKNIWLKKSDDGISAILSCHNKYSASGEDDREEEKIDYAFERTITAEDLTKEGGAAALLMEVDEEEAGNDDGYSYYSLLSSQQQQKEAAHHVRGTDNTAAAAVIEDCNSSNFTGGDDAMMVGGSNNYWCRSRIKSVPSRTVLQKHQRGSYSKTDNNDAKKTFIPTPASHSFW